MKFLFIILSVFFIVPATQAQLTTSKLFGDHMVLQRNHDIPVWGQSVKKAKISVSFNKQLLTVKADELGNWKATLHPMQEGGPYIMKISSGKESITYSDIMLGEVWLCSGQSNMEFQLKNAYGYKTEQKIAAKIAVRQFHVPSKISLTPEKDLASGQWTIAAANTIGDFTAVGYFYAKQLAQNLHVTVGIINSSWGGTEAEDWISRDAMLGSPELNAIVPTLPQNADGLKQRTDKLLKAWAYHNKPVVNYTSEELAAKSAYFFENWQHGNAPGSWEWMGKLYSYRGQGFMQRTISLDSSYLQSAQKDPSWFGIGLNGAGMNDLNVRFADTTVNLADGNWHVMPDLSKPYHFDFLPNNNAFTLYNGMVNPLIPFAIAGVIWYQGESNADRAYQYRSVFPLLITDWRNKWKQQLPFLFVQLSSFGASQSSNFGSSWAELREAQNMALQLPNTGLAVTTDIGDAFNIHPKDKADVGYRLAASALTNVYHLPGFFESPLFAAADFTNGYAMVNFKNAESGLMAKDIYNYVKGFELAGADHKFYYAQAVITDKNKVKVSCSAVPNPVAVRYGWTNSPIDANLFSIQGLPVSPFRSDTWDGITLGHNFE
jgi:sialate O-acetylesterase